MEPNADNEYEENEIQQSHYIIIDSSILELFSSVIGVYQNKEIKMYNDVSKKKGLPTCIAITCSECNFSYSTYSSKKVNKPNTPGKKPFDVNARCIIAFREIGKGFNAIENNFGLMNCVPPMNSKSFSEMNKSIADSYYFVAKESMQNAAKDLRSGTEGICDVAVSCDGSWQKRGFEPLNGLVLKLGKLWIFVCLPRNVPSAHFGRIIKTMWNS